MNWKLLRPAPWLDTRARFVTSTPRASALLDLGSSDGETLRHFAELRPDLRLFAADKFGAPEKYPAGCDFRRADFESASLPWPEARMDAVTCMHVVEHLQNCENLMREATRVLKPGGAIYFETPHPKTTGLPRLGEKFTMNFHDDPTHVRPVPVEELAALATRCGLRPVQQGISRNWLFALAHPFFALLPDSRKKFTARVHWLGWSAYLVARKPQ
ncbi:MAG: SAM-dependent methyltransferase [Verrucomicrobia bacterium]|nr:MAG: SAM-dependent methyltransferase [Verrucomicrobiota bacterium]